MAKSGGKGVAVPAPYEAVHGAWIVSCTPCVSYEEAACHLVPVTDAATGLDGRYLMLFPDDESDPQTGLAMSFVPSGGLAFGTVGTLSVAVDGDKIAALTEPDAVYTEMYGELFVQPEAVERLLPALTGGTTLDLGFTDDAGTGEERYSLDGFAAAVDDLRAHLPAERAPDEAWANGTCQ
ncbi:MAG: hypothetical protein R3F55_07680 [Alphaproteobacteria bacterium]